MKGGNGAGRLLAIAASVIAIATVVTAIIMMDSPATQRAARLDVRRVNDLSRIVTALDEQVQRNNALPPTLETLVHQPGLKISIVDPVSGSPYDYEVVDARRFRLCAVFSTDSAKVHEEGLPWPSDKWNHSTGRQCFERTAKGESKQD